MTYVKFIPQSHTVSMPWHRFRTTTDVLTFTDDYNQEGQEVGGLGWGGGMGEAQNWANSDMLVGKNTI